MKKIIEHIYLTLALLGVLLCGFALVASVSASRQAGYLGGHLMNDRHPADGGVMTVYAPQVEDDRG